MNKSNLAVFFILFSLSLTVIFYSQKKPVLLFRNYLSETLKPPEIIFSKIGDGVLFLQNIFFNIKRIKELNVALTNENLELYGKLVKVFQLEEENDFLREKLNLTSKKSWDTSLANIIGRDFENNRSFIIDRGSNDGIAIGMPVVLKGEVVIGKISDVSYNSSKVKTIIDTQSKIAAITIESKISGLARGLGSDIVLDLIAKNKSPKVGDLVISSGVDGLWPRGLIIGKVKNIISEETSVFNSADIELLTDFRDFDRIFVILNSLNP